MAAACVQGLVFSISPGKPKPKKTKNEEEELNLLTLAPFTRPPKISFGNEVKPNESVERALVIHNPQEFTVDLVISNQELNINNFPVSVESKKDMTIRIKWQPEKPGIHKYTIIVECTSTPKFKFIVHAFGTCVKPPEKKKPLARNTKLNVLQPLKKEKSTDFNQTTTVIKLTTITNKPLEITSQPQPSKVSIANQTVVMQENIENIENIPNPLEMTAKKPNPIRNTNLYDDLDQTPKAPSLLHAATESKTPKLSDFMRPTSPYNAYLNADMNSTCIDFLKPPAPSSLIPSSSTNLDLTTFFSGNNARHSDMNGAEITFNMGETSHSPFHLNQPETVKKSLYSDLDCDEDEEIMNLRRGTFVVAPNPITHPAVLKSVLFVQRAWRRKQLAKKDRQHFLQMKELYRQRREIEAQVEEARLKQEAEIRKLEEEAKRKELELAEMKRIEKEREDLMFRCVTDCQRWVRMKRFRRCLRGLRLKRLEHCATVVQKQWRMNQFRKNLKLIRQQREEEKRRQLENKSAAMIQRWYRAKRNPIRVQYLKLTSSLPIIQQKCRELIAKREASATKLQHWYRYMRFRRELNKYRAAAVKIQRWHRAMKQRYNFIKVRRNVLKIQIIYKKLYMVRRTAAAVRVQAFWRMHAARKELLRLKEEKNQLEMRKNKCATLIQANWRGYKQRRCFKSSKKAAMVIQRQWRMTTFRKHVRMIKEQREAERQRQIELEAQRRERAALRIQSYWRMISTRRPFLKQLEELRQKETERKKHELHLNKCATRIQAQWRGYKQRKLTSNQQISSIRTRLSFYQGIKSNSSTTSLRGLAPSGSSTANLLLNMGTLGERIRRALDMLVPFLPIQQMVIALTDLVKVTRLSPECCRVFVEENSVEFLYNLIYNCNRSIPHADIIKLCLQIFINLAKYDETQSYVLAESDQHQPPLTLLSNLLSNYYVSNPSIFMQACILLIIMAGKYNEAKNKILAETELIRRLETIHAALERRCLSDATKKFKTIMSFTMYPDWSLSRRHNESIELVNSLGALNYLMKNVLNVQLQGSQSSLSSLSSTVKTPHKLRNLDSTYVAQTTSAKKPKLTSSGSFDLLKSAEQPRAGHKKSAKNLYEHETVAFSAKKITSDKSGMKKCSSQELANIQTPKINNVTQIIEEQSVYYEANEDISYLSCVEGKRNEHTFIDESYYYSLGSNEHLAQSNGVIKGMRNVNTTRPLNSTMMMHQITEFGSSSVLDSDNL